MQIPPLLRTGDRVALISTARKVTREEVAPAIQVLEGWGLKVQEGKHLFSEDRQFAGTVEERQEDLQWALDDPKVRAVLCARGGYGTVQILDGLKFDTFIQDPKWIIGYSDVTVLHAHIHRHFEVPTLHASMAANFEKDRPEALDSLHRALFKELDNYGFQGKAEFDRQGKAQGTLIGGNLSVLYSLTGTDSIFDPGGKILFIEDLDEYLYHVDRMMQNLRKSGILSNIEGLLVGGLTEMNDNKVPYGKSATEIVADAVKDLDIPVAYGFPAGHLPEQRALYFGVPVELRVGERNELRFL
ncbi:MAG: LD-carboxypeptidase [Flavobacteriales bacterium]